MKSAEHYANRLQEFTSEFRKALSALTEDDVVETQEVTSGREIIEGFKKKVKLLKKEITLDIKTIRSSYKAQVLAVRASSAEDKTQRVRELNLQENQALSVYQQALESMESALIGGDKAQQMFMEMSEDIEQLQGESTVSVSAEDELSLEERLLPLLSKWQTVMDEAEHKLNMEHHTVHDAAQVAYWQGVKETIEGVLKDLRSALTEPD